MSSITETKVVRHISRHTIKPQSISAESQQPCYLTPWDLPFLSVEYIQVGYLYHKPQHVAMQTILDQLKASLSATLTHFYPLSGRLVTVKNPDTPFCSVFLDCRDGLGAEFVHAVVDATISDILSPFDVPPIVERLFALDRPINHDGHTSPLLALQITELVDGVFIGCSFNHVVGDGASFTHFFYSWSEISRSMKQNVQCTLTRPPVTERFFLNYQDRIINLPFPNEFIQRQTPEPYRERVFHFTCESMAHLKAVANNADNLKPKSSVSSFLALAALVWRSVTRARGLLADEEINCVIFVNDRPIIEPPLSKDYFGNCVSPECATTTVRELLANNLGWCALKLQEAVARHTNAKLRSVMEAYIAAPFVNDSRSFASSKTITFGGSPKFDFYMNDFGWGKPIGTRTGCGWKYDGKVETCASREGGGSVDLEICLAPNSMSALETDDEFMGAVSRSPNAVQLSNL